MADKMRFSRDLLSLIDSANFDSLTMVALSRALLRNDYSDSEFEQEFFSIFILIDEEASDIILDGFGDYNFPSGRHEIGSKLNIVKLVRNSGDHRDAYSNSKLYWRELDELSNLYQGIFLESLQQFKSYFRI